MTGENGGRADLDSDAQDRTFPAAGQHAGSGLEIRNRRAAPHPHQVLEANRRLEPQVFRDIRGETRAEVAGAGVDDQAGYASGFDASLRQRAACGGDSCGTAELEKARQPPVGIGFEGIRFGIHPQIPALNLTVQENAAIQILFGRFQVEVRVEEFVGLLLRCIEWGGGGAQTSENGLQEFAPGLNLLLAAASTGSQSGRSRNSAAVARDSNTPEASRYHGIVQFGVLSQHLAAVLGRDRNGLRRNPLAIATSLAVQGGAVTVAKTVQEIIRDLPRIHPDRTLRQRREPALQVRQFGQRFQSQRIHLPRLPEVTQSPERFLTDRFLEAIRQQQSGQIAIEPPLAVGFDAPQQFRRRNPSFEKLEGRVPHRFIGGEVLRPDPGRLDELRRIGQAQPRTAQEAVVDEERAGVVRCMCETVLMIGLQRTVQKADVVRTNKPWPASTVSPSATSRRTILPGMGATTFSRPSTPCLPAWRDQRRGSRISTSKPSPSMKTTTPPSDCSMRAS